MNVRTCGAYGFLAVFWGVVLLGLVGGSFAQDQRPGGSPTLPAREVDGSKKFSQLFEGKDTTVAERQDPGSSVVPPPAKPEAPPRLFRDESGYFELLPASDMVLWLGWHSTSPWVLYEGVTQHSGIAFTRREALKHPWKSFAVHRLEKGLAIDFLRDRVARHVASLRGQGRDASGPYQVDVGPDGALGVGCSWVTTAGDPPASRTYEEVWVVMPTGTWNIVFGFERPVDRSSLLQMRHSFRFLVPRDAEVGIVLPWHPREGRVPEHFGLRWDGKEENEQCGWAVDQFARWYLGRSIPSTWPAGVKKLWEMETPGFRKVPNGQRSLPPPGALLLWNGRAKEPGHIAVVLAANQRNRWVRVIDCNSRRDRRGYIREISLNDRQILGWLVRE